MTALDFTLENLDYKAVISSSSLCCGVVDAIQQTVAQQAQIKASQVRVGAPVAGIHATMS